MMSSRWFAFCAGLVVAGAAPALADLSSDLVLDRAVTLTELRELVKAGDEVARLASALDGTGQRPLTQRARALRDRLARFEKVAMAPPPPAPPRLSWCGRPVPSGSSGVDPCARAAMSAADFQAFARAVRDARYPSLAMGLVQQAAQHNFLSVDQVGEVMGWFRGEDDKIMAAIVLWPRLADPDRAYALYGNLRSPEGRSVLRERIDALGP